MPSFAPLLGKAPRASTEVLDLVATADGGFAALFADTVDSGRDDGDIHRFGLVFFERDQDGTIRRIGPATIVATERASDITLTAGIAAAPDGGVLFVERRLQGDVSKFVTREFSSEGVQIAAFSQNLDGNFALGAFFDRGSMDLGGAAAAVSGTTGELAFFAGKPVRIKEPGIVVPEGAAALGLDDGTVVVSPSRLTPGNFSEGFTLESLAGTGSDVTLDFQDLDPDFTPLLSSAGNTAAAFMTFRLDAPGFLGLAVSKPDEGPAPLTDLARLEEMNLLPSAGAVEAPGVGYIVVQGARHAGTGTFGALRVQVVDFEGDLIAETTLDGVVSPNANALRVAGLSSRDGDGLRIAVVQNIVTNTATGTANSSTVEFIELFPAIETTGTSLDDFLVGFDKGDVLEGGDGADRLHAGAGVDFLSGDDGADRVFGGAGADFIEGGEGRDRLFGGDGADGLGGGEGRDVVLGGGGGDLLVGDGDADRLEGGGGNDDLRGDEGDDRLKGEAGNDKLDGGEGDDGLDGGAGRDVLIGGLGSDLLTGGGQADRFVFRTVEDAAVDQAPDIVGDFSRKQGDRIDLRAIDAKQGGGDDAFRILKGDDFTGKAGQLKISELLGGSLVAGDVDGDGEADFAFLVDNGGGALKAGDFLL